MIAGDIGGTEAAPTVVGLNGTSLAGLASGLLYNTTTTGVPSIATGAQITTTVQSLTGCNTATYVYTPQAADCVAPGGGGAPTFPPLAKTTTYQVLAADFSACKTITTNSTAFTITLVASTSQPTAGQCIWILNYGNANITVAPSGQNINGAGSNVAVYQGLAFVVSDGMNYFLSPLTTASTNNVLVGNGIHSTTNVEVDINTTGSSLIFEGAKDKIFMANATNDISGTTSCSSSTFTKTFSSSYTSTPVIVISDETTAGGAKVTSRSNSAFTVTCTGASDAVDWIVTGAPN